MRTFRIHTQKAIGVKTTEKKQTDLSALTKALAQNNSIRVANIIAAGLSNKENAK